jgi:hypothetical protein
MFLIRQNTQIKVCQIRITPFKASLRFRKRGRKLWNKKLIVDETTKIIRNHQWILDHTSQVDGQDKCVVNIFFHFKIHLSCPISLQINE